MSITKTVALALLLGMTLFSGSARKLLTIATNAVEADALAGGGQSGASCD